MPTFDATFLFKLGPRTPSLPECKPTQIVVTYSGLTLPQIRENPVVKASKKMGKTEWYDAQIEEKIPPGIYYVTPIIVKSRSSMPQFRREEFMCKEEIMTPAAVLATAILAQMISVESSPDPFSGCIVLSGTEVVGKHGHVGFYYENGQLKPTYWDNLCHDFVFISGCKKIG